MKIDVEELKSKLENLTGKDFIDAEKDARNSGDMMPLITFSTEFQIRLAARALKTNPRELETLPLNQYTKVASTVSNFLFSDNDTTENEEETNHETPSEK